MKSLVTFIKKEFIEHLRTGKALILFVIFVLFGVMNPAMAKITPWLLDMLSDTLEESGMSIGTVEVDALTSWAQFFKNIPMGLIVFIVVESNIFTKEYQSGTLVMALTKGIKRCNVVIAKTFAMVVIWSVCYVVCFGITYGYNAYFWDNGICENLLLSGVCWWALGVLAVTVISFGSAVLNSNVGVLMSCLGVFAVSYVVGLVPKISRFSPSRLSDGNSLIAGALEAGDYVLALGVCLVVSIAFIVAAVVLFNRKRL